VEERRWQECVGDLPLDVQTPGPGVAHQDDDEAPQEGSEDRDRNGNLHWTPPMRPDGEARGERRQKDRDEKSAESSDFVLVMEGHDGLDPTSAPRQHEADGLSCPEERALELLTRVDLDLPVPRDDTENLVVAFKRAGTGQRSRPGDACPGVHPARQLGLRSLAEEVDPAAHPSTDQHDHRDRSDDPIEGGMRSRRCHL